jgi:hypothetical protein
VEIEVKRQERATVYDRRPDNTVQVSIDPQKLSGYGTTISADRISRSRQCRGTDHS